MCHSHRFSFSTPVLIISEYQLTGWGWRALTCVGWHVTLCDPIWQVTSNSCETEQAHTFNLFTRATLSVERVFATATCLSVRPSVCLSQPVLYQNGNS